MGVVTRKVPALLVGLAFGIFVGFLIGAYPIPGAGTFAIPVLRDEVRRIGEPSPMDELYAKSLAACRSFNAVDAVGFDGGRMIIRDTPPFKKYLDDFKIIGTDEKRFASAICRTYLAGKSASIDEKPIGYVVHRGDYDAEIN